MPAPVGGFGLVRDPRASRPRFAPLSRYCRRRSSYPTRPEFRSRRSHARARAVVPGHAVPPCFDWERPRPLKTNIHKQLIREDPDRAAVRRAGGLLRRPALSGVTAGRRHANRLAGPTGRRRHRQGSRARPASVDAPRRARRRRPPDAALRRHAHPEGAARCPADSSLWQNGSSGPDRSRFRPA